MALAGYRLLPSLQLLHASCRGRGVRRVCCSRD
jgi:hypothetical protein